MFSRVNGSAVLGVDGIVIDVEADVSDGLPVFTMVGYLSSSVKEAGERVRTALKNSGFQMSPKRITINLSPADIKKDGSGFDLPIAIAVLFSIGIRPVIDMEKTVLIGELGLDGVVRPVSGILPMVNHCHNKGMKRCIIPWENQGEATIVKDMEVIGVKNLKEAVEYIQGIKEIPPIKSDKKSKEDYDLEENLLDFSDIKGQDMLKRGMEIAVAGFHNVLMSGAAGAGKSMLAKRLPTIMPELSFEESVEVTKIYSVSGYLKNKNNLITQRPFRSPHHTISNHALIGGGVSPRPGEVSLAHNGILFLDEFCEYKKDVLEVMRQPLEERKVTISRVNATYVFPADFMLIAAMNPCPCGNFPDRKKCKCTEYQIKKYQSKISGPLLDRIDINMQVKPVENEELFENYHGESSKTIRERIECAVSMQKNRYINEEIKYNSHLEGSMVKKFIKLEPDEECFVKNIHSKNKMSARGYTRILKLSRTIADLDGSEKIKKIHIAEAEFYKNGNNFFEGR